jgi:hypothetical protein
MMKPPVEVSGLVANIAVGVSSKSVMRELSAALTRLVDSMDSIGVPSDPIWGVIAALIVKVILLPTLIVVRFTLISVP